jgi:Holliday junction resolvase
MSRQRAGLRKEHELAQSIYDNSGGSIIPLRAGWSGNSAVPAPDLLIPYRGTLRALEIKTTNQKRLVVDKEDLEDVVKWAMDMTEVSVFPYLTVKFSYYEAQTMRIERPWDIDASLDAMVDSAPFEARRTRGGNISFGSPKNYECDVIGANASPGDGVAVIRDLKEDEYASKDDSGLDTVGVYEVLKEGDDYFDF